MQRTEQEVLEAYKYIEKDVKIECEEDPEEEEVKIEFVEVKQEVDAQIESECDENNDDPAYESCEEDDDEDQHKKISAKSAFKPRSGKKSKVCPVCNKTFVKPCVLKVHMRYLYDSY